MRSRVRALLLMILLIAIPGLLLAHGALKRSEPAASTTLLVAPRAIRLTFTEPAELAVGRIELAGPDGLAIALSPVRHGDSVTVMVADVVGSLRPGRYTVAWQVAGRDGHPVRGTYWFVIADGATGLTAATDPGRASSAADTEAAKVAGIHDDHGEGDIPDVDAFDAESPLFAAIRWTGFLGLMTLVGTVAFTRLVVPGAMRRQAPADWGVDARRNARRVGLAAIAVLFVALLLRLAAQSVAVHGSIAGFDSSLLTGTTWGKAWLAQLIGLAAVAAALVPARDTAASSWLLPVATIAIAASFAFSGHAAAVPEYVPFAVPIDTLHILGAGGWIGTLLLLVVVGLPAAMRSQSGDRGRTVALVVNAFSPLALIFAATAALTGIVSGWTQLGSVAALWTTRYGQILLIKLVLVLMVIAAGTYNSYRVRPTLGDESGGPRIQRSATAELLVAALVLAVTAVLVATPTPAATQ